MRRFKKFKFYQLIVILFVLFSPQLTLAQEKNIESKKLETITVTAQKQEENVQEVPISITVFTETDIVDKKIESVKDIAPFTPNLTLFDNSGAGNFTTTIRGIQSSGTSFSTSAALLIDGIPILFANGMDETLMDIERIEVLKGPQSSLYGKDTEAGAINIITRKPGNEFIGKIGAEFGSDNKRQYSFTASGPMVKNKLSLGVSGQHYEKEGFIKNTYLDTISDDRENDSGKITLRWTPVDALEILLISTKGKRDDGKSNVNESSVAKPVIHTDMDEYTKTDSFMNSLKIEYNKGTYKLNSITTQRLFDADSLYDYDYSLATGYHVLEKTSYEKISQEFRLSSQRGGLNWLIGFYADKDDNYQNNLSTMSSGSSQTFRNFDGDSIGVFAHVDYKVNEKIGLITGLRYDRDNKEYEDELDGSNNEDSSYSEISPKLTFKYTQNENLMAYATIAKGYRSGGFHPYSAPGYKKGYDKETLWNYEIGCKTAFMKNRLFLNGAVYYMDIDDMQVKSSVDYGLSYMSNAAKATSKGFELEVTAKATRYLKIFTSFGYNVTEFDDFADFYGNYDGNVNPYAPKYNYNVGAQYRTQQGYFARADLNGYGKTYLDNANQYNRTAYNLVNAKVGYEAENFDIYFYANNLFDKNYDTIGAYGGYYRIYSPPREIGVQVAYRF